MIRSFQNSGFLLLLILLLSGLFAWGTGCSRKAADERVTIKLSAWGSAEETAVLKSLIQQFEKQHPRIQVELLHIPENYFQKLHILIAGGLTPDVMFVNSLSFPVYAQNNILLPLEEPLNDGQSPLSDRVFFEPALKALRWNGRLYAIPRDVSNLVVFYNQDLFQQAEVSLPRPDWTLEEMLALGKKLTRDTDGDGIRDRFGVSFFAKPPLFWLPFVWSRGGELFNPDLTQVRLTEPKAIEALQFYVDLRNRWHVAPTRKEVGSASMSQLFLQGDLAMLISGRWSVPVLRQQATFRWDVAPFPKGEAGSVVGIDASGYAIAKESKHPKESWALVAFLSSVEAQEAFSESGLIVPARQDVAQSPRFLEPPPLHGRYFIDAVAGGSPTHVPARWNEIAEELGLALEPVWEGTQQAEPAIRAVAPKIERLLQ